VGSHTWQSLGHTAALLALTAVLVIVLSLLIGVVAASWVGSPLDLVLRGFTYVAWAVPPFLLALVLQSASSWAGERFGFRPFALTGWPGQCLMLGGPVVRNCTQDTGDGVQYAVSFLRHLTLPAGALAVAFVGLHARYLRSSLLVALHAPYTTTARAKGLPERRVVLRHALRNSLATFVSAMLLDFGAIFGAALAVDWIFQLNGLGTLFLYEIQTASINPYAVQLLLVVTAAMVIAAGLASELAVGWLDPRARPR
jgi:peptide/nickel transport system permease protein